MRYEGIKDFEHGELPALGILITNLGTPAAPTPQALRRYLGEFLADPRVVEAPRLLWRAVLHGVILRIRPRRSAAAYRAVWGEDGSPLLAIAGRQKQALETLVDKRLPGRVRVALAMRYGEPSIHAGLTALRDAGVRRILILPMYPQYSATTTGSTFDAVADVLKRWRWIPELRMITHYHDEPGYIAALANRIRAEWDTLGQPQKLLFSFHGIPKRYFLSGDPYFCQCHKTARLVAERLGLGDKEWQVAFQSRFGREEWLKPYTDHVLQHWPVEGIKNVHVVCPGFSADCLETLEEIAQQNRDWFLEAGGESFHYIPALNDSNEHMQALAGLVQTHCQGWPEASPQWSHSAEAAKAQARTRRARDMGASS